MHGFAYAARGLNCVPVLPITYKFDFRIVFALARRVTDGMFLDAAKALAQMVTQKDLDETAVFPDLNRIRECSHAVACATVRRAVAEGHADKEILENLDETIRRAMWMPEYLPIRYEG